MATPNFPQTCLLWTPQNLSQHLLHPQQADSLPRLPYPAASPRGVPGGIWQPQLTRAIRRGSDKVASDRQECAVKGSEHTHQLKVLKSPAGCL